jgi:hypothetical protein
MSQSKAWTEGYNHGLDAKNRNPYPKDSKEFKEYEEGFDYAILSWGQELEDYYG